MRLTHVLAAVAAAGAAAAPAPAAFAADAVFGGKSTQGDPIVVRSDPDTQKLRSLGISWRAVCDDGNGFPGAGTLTPVEPVAGFSPASTELLVSRNANGTFNGTQLRSSDLGNAVAAISVQVAGKLKPSRATGTLNAVVKVVDKAAGSTLATCEARLRWTAMRKPGIFYGGATSQDQPIVLRLDARRTRVNDVIVAWHGPCTSSGGFIRTPEHFVNFRLKRTGNFGNPFSDVTPLESGGKSLWEYRLTGRVTRTKASGVLEAKVSDTDAAGVATDSCDAGRLSWKAVTG